MAVLVVERGGASARCGFRARARCGVGPAAHHPRVKIVLACGVRGGHGALGAERPALLDGRGRGQVGGLDESKELVHVAQVGAVGLAACATGEGHLRYPLLAATLEAEETVGPVDAVALGGAPEGRLRPVHLDHVLLIQRAQGE